jgi:RNA polymerase sigma factor (sigma-70 family)
MSGESEIIENLVQEGARGDRSAQSQLLERYWPLIRRVVRARRRRMGGALRDDTDDLEQQVAMELLESLPKQEWRGQTAFGAWVRRLAECQVIDAQRYHARQKRDRRAETDADKADLVAARPSPESAIDEGRRAEAIVAAIGELKEEYGAALVLHYKGYSHAQIGDVLGCTAEAARKLVARARAKLSARGLAES